MFVLGYGVHMLSLATRRFEGVTFSAWEGAGVLVGLLMLVRFLATEGFIR